MKKFITKSNDKVSVEIQNVETKITSNVKAEVANVKAEVANVKTEITAEVANVKTEVQSIKENQAEMMEMMKQILKKWTREKILLIRQQFKFSLYWKYVF